MVFFCCVCWGFGFGVWVCGFELFVLGVRWLFNCGFCAFEVRILLVVLCWFICR